MSTWTVEATVNIRADITPEGEFEDSGSALEFADLSSFFGDCLDFEGNVSFKVEGDDEEEAREAASNILDNELTFSSNDGLEWEIQGADITDITREEMSKDEAVLLIRQFLDRMADRDMIDARTREAFDVILTDL